MLLFCQVKLLTPALDGITVKYDIYEINRVKIYIIDILHFHNQYGVSLLICYSPWNMAEP